MTELLIVGLGEVVDDKEIFEPNIQASLGSYKKNQASKNSPFHGIRCVAVVTFFASVLLCCLFLP